MEQNPYNMMDRLNEEHKLHFVCNVPFFDSGGGASRVTHDWILVLHIFGWT
jgi:hypothetical protein